MSSPNYQPWSAWNQKLHVYLGLYFLVFLWLFAASGLLLNHGWKFAEFWSFSMDALVVGLIGLVLTSGVLVLERRERWLGAALAFGLGVALCGFFVFGLRWL